MPEQTGAGRRLPGRGAVSPDTGPRPRLWRRWVLATTAGEAVGFLLPALAAGLIPSSAGDLVRLVVLVVAGAGEGAVLGWAQSRVLRRPLPDLRVSAWTVRTALAAAVAWLIGMLPSVLSDRWTRLPAVVVAALGVVAGGVLLASIGVAQWTVLRRHLRGSGWWIGWTALGWAAALVVFTLVATPLWRPGQSDVLVAAIGAVAGVLMAVTVAVVTGWGLIHLLGRNRTVAAVG
jgi:hypothetical protein